MSQRVVTRKELSRRMSNDAHFYDPKTERLAVRKIPTHTIITFPKSHSVEITDLTPRISSLGNLNTLAVELIQLVILNLDLRSIACLRLTVYGFQNVIGEMVEYQRLRKHAFNMVRALKETGALGYHTLGILYKSLTTKHCPFCGDFAPCSFLLTAEKCCLNCAALQPALRLIPTHYAPQYYAISRNNISDLDALDVIPGKYRCHASAGKITVLQPGRPLVLESAVLERAITMHGSRQAMDDVLTEVYDNANISWERRRFLWDNPIYAHYPERHPSYTTHRNMVIPRPLEGYRNVGVVEMPYFDEATGKVEKGVFCKGCRDGYLHPYGHKYFAQSLEHNRRLPKIFVRAYSEKDFVEHVETCEEVVKLLKVWREEVA